MAEEEKEEGGRSPRLQLIERRHPGGRAPSIQLQTHIATTMRLRDKVRYLLERVNQLEGELETSQSRVSVLEHDYAESQRRIRELENESSESDSEKDSSDSGYETQENYKTK